MAKSLICNERICWRCGTSENLHKHHIFYGTANRKKSEEDGCWCYLCGVHHNLSNQGVHFDKRFDLYLKRHCQMKWEAEYGDRSEFIKRYGKSYL